LVAEGDFKVGAHCQFFLSIDVGDGGWKSPAKAAKHGRCR
jgi:hypothetical protein